MSSLLIQSYLNLAFEVGIIENDVVPVLEIVVSVG